MPGRLSHWKAGIQLGKGKERESAAAQSAGERLNRI